MVLVVVALLFIVGAFIWFIPKLRARSCRTSAAGTIWHAPFPAVAELMIGNTVNA